MTIKRTIRVLTEMACCRDGQEAYRPQTRPIKAETIKDDFETSLTIWRDRAEDILYEKYNAMANDECAGMGTLTLCLFNLSVISVDEIGEPTKPRFVDEEEEMLKDELDYEVEKEPLISRYAKRAGKVLKRLKKTIAKEIFEKRFGGERAKPIVKELAKGYEDEYYEQAERERATRQAEAERYEVPEVVIQQLQILQNRMERTEDADEYNSLRKEYDMLVQRYGLTEEE